jgi:hypothetical protein
MPTVKIELAQNLALINSAVARNEGMDIVIVSTPTVAQEKFWESRLQATAGQITNSDAVILCICEDWPGGAGNGLGSLYAFKKASEKAEKLGINLIDKIEEGTSAAIYHTAGKGTRLAPLPGSENNNKSAIKLPGQVKVGDDLVPMTLLEAVIKQTALFAHLRKGRVSVFWGDQIFIPSKKPASSAEYPVDILTHLETFPSAEQWKEKRLSTYGLIGVDSKGNATQVEKIEHSVASDLIKNGCFNVDKGFGISLGAFSLSSKMLRALLEEFDSDLKQKKTKLDSDPDFWMPLTLKKEVYSEMMKRKGRSAETATAQFARMESFKNKYFKDTPGILGAVDIGNNGYWWDYGQLRYFYKNNLKLLKNDSESHAMKSFYNIPSNTAENNGVKINNSVLINCQIKKGTLNNCVLMNVKADEVEASDSILLDVTAPQISGRNIVLYNVTDSEKIALSDRGVRADSSPPGVGKTKIVTSLDRDGGADWNQKLPNNSLSYEELYQANLKS